MKRKPIMLSGNEKLQYQGSELPFTVLNFWQVNLSELLLNVTRGSFAEYIVLCALSACMSDALSQSKTGMEAWDIDGPELDLPDGIRRSRIEVKSAASVQIDTPDEKEPICLPASRLNFSIHKAVNYESDDSEPHRNNDLYVFCLYKAARKSENILNLDLWEFYVLPTYVIDEDPVLEKQKTISLKKLQMLGVQAQSFGTLCDAILRTQSKITEHYKKLK